MFEALIALVSMVALLLGSPGPATLALATVGATYGVQRGVPFLLGILSGLMIAIIGAILSLSALFSFHPIAVIVVQFLGFLYVMYVAIKIAATPITIGDDNQVKTPSFFDGLVLNLLNPKAYAAFFAIFSQFLVPIENRGLAFLLTAVICMLVAIIVDGIWLVLGGAIKPVFRKPKQARLFRVTCGVLLVLVVSLSFYHSVLKV